MGSGIQRSLSKGSLRDEMGVPPSHLRHLRPPTTGACARSPLEPHSVIYQPFNTCGSRTVSLSDKTGWSPPATKPSGTAPQGQWAHLPEAELAVEVLVHLFDHVFQAQVGLGGPEFLHHELQLHQVNEAVPAGIIPVGTERGLRTPWLLTPDQSGWSQARTQGARGSEGSAYRHVILSQLEGTSAQVES